MSRYPNYSGRKFNHLTLITKVRQGGSGVGSIWIALCDCGQTKEVVARNVVSGRVKTCGKCQYSSRLRSGRLPGKASKKKQLMRLYTRDADRALSAGATWSLTPEQYLRIISTKCRYCGSEPRERRKGIRLPRNLIALIDVSLSYTPDNCIAACEECRRRKGDSNHAEYVDSIISQAIHLARTSTPAQTLPDSVPIDIPPN